MEDGGWGEQEGEDLASWSGEAAAYGGHAAICRRDDARAEMKKKNLLVTTDERSFRNATQCRPPFAGDHGLLKVGFNLDNSRPVGH